jgi:mannose-6-phosphate isomerase-like protein (cupin superfamily)
MTAIDQYKPENEFYTEERCYITELRKTTVDPACSIARARVEPGITTRFHILKGTIERYVILEGAGLVEVGDEKPSPVHPMDVVTIPADTRQRITNTGEVDLIFLCVCTPGFDPLNYFDVE